MQMSIAMTEHWNSTNNKLCELPSAIDSKCEIRSNLAILLVAWQSICSKRIWRLNGRPSPAEPFRYGMCPIGVFYLRNKPNKQSNKIISETCENFAGKTWRGLWWRLGVKSLSEDFRDLASHLLSVRKANSQNVVSIRLTHGLASDLMGNTY